MSLTGNTCYQIISFCAVTFGIAKSVNFNDGPVLFRRKYSPCPVINLVKLIGFEITGSRARGSMRRESKVMFQFQAFSVNRIVRSNKSRLDIFTKRARSFSG